MSSSTRAALLALSCVALAPAAWAACAPEPAFSGQLVVCEDVDADGFIAGVGVTDIVLDIRAGASVASPGASDPDIAIGLGARSELRNAGSVVTDGAVQTRNTAVDLAGDDVTLSNSGTISATLSDTALVANPGRDDHALTAIAVGASGAAARTTIDLSGDVSVVHRGSGAAAALHIGAAANGVDVVFGQANAVLFPTIQISRLGGLTDAAGNNLVPSMSAGPSGELLATNPLTGVAREYGMSGAVVADAGAGAVTLVNRAASITSNDFFTPALYLLASQVSLTTTEGFISNSASAPLDFLPGIALASSGRGSIAIDLRNIASSAWSGDIVIADVNPLRWWAQERLGITGLDLTANQTGIRNSTVTAVHAIAGNVYLGSGRHVWRFSPLETDGVIGSVVVDQRNLSGSATLGARQFQFAGAMLTGALEIRDVPGARNIVTLQPGGSVGALTATTNDGDNELRLVFTRDSSRLPRFGGLFANVAGFDRLHARRGALWTLAAPGRFEFTESVQVDDGARLEVGGTLETPRVNLQPGATLLGSGVVSGDVFMRGATLAPGRQAGVGTFDFSQARLTIAGALNLDARSVIETHVFGEGGAGVETPTDNATQVFVGATGKVARGALVRPVIDGTRVTNRESFRVLHNTAGAAVFDALPAVDVLDSALIDWRLASNRAGDVVITARPRPLAPLPWRSDGAHAAVEALLAYDGDDAFLPQLAGELQSIADADEMARTAEALRPDDNDAPLFAATHLMTRFVDLASARLAVPRTGHGPETWLTGFGSHVSRDRIDGSVGFALDDAGLAAGIDSAIHDRLRVGVALNYGSSDVNEGGERAGAGLELDSFAGLLYGAYATDDINLRAVAGAGLLRYDTRRLVRAVQFGDNNAGKHAGFDVVVETYIGKPLRFSDGRVLEPFLALRYLHVWQDAYRESTILGGRETIGFTDGLIHPPIFGDGARLAVSDSRADSFSSALGMRASLPLPWDISDGDARVEVGALWRHEFGNPAYDTRAAFVAGGPGFNVNGVGLPDDSGEFDVALAVRDGYGQQLDLGYHAELDGATLSHGGTLRYQHSFDEDLPLALLDLPRSALAGAGALFGGLCLTCALAPEALETVVVRGKRERRAVAVLDGLALDRHQLSSNVQSLDADDIRRARVASVGELLGAKLQSVNINDYQGNPFQLDVSFRGFTAGPQLGTPQGLSVVFDGIRVNEAFGDVVNWDLVPLNAIASFDVFPGSNPLYGLNTLGGALVLRSRNGFDDPGVTASLQGGSWERKHGQLSAGASHGPVAGFVALTGFDEGGWRDNSPTRVEQAFSRIDLRNGALGANFSVLAAGNDLVGNGMLPTTLYERDMSAVYTSPDKTDNNALTLNLAAAFEATEHLSFNARIYRRTSDRGSAGGDIYEGFEDLDGQFDGQAAPVVAMRGGHPLCRIADANRDSVVDWGIDRDGDGVIDPGSINQRPTENEVNSGQFQALAPLNGPLLSDGASIPVGQPGCVVDFWRGNGQHRRGAGLASGVIDGTPIGVLNSVEIGQSAQGSAFHINWNSEHHHLLVGASVDHQRSHFLSSQQLAGITADHRVVVDPSIDPIYAAAFRPVVNSNFGGFSNTESVFASDTLSLFERLHVSFAARYNFTRVKTRVGSRERSGGNDFTRVNLHNFRNFDARGEYILCNGASLDTCPDAANTSAQGQLRRMADRLQLPGFARDDRRDLRATREKIRYHSLNPSVGLSFAAHENLDLYANWSQGTRTPSVVELGCAYDGHFVDVDGIPNNGSQQIPRSIFDNTVACNLPTALSGDPFLPQIFARTTEFGARGVLPGTWRWNASAYRTNLYDDIYLVGVNASSSFFDTIGKTRREGIELGISGQLGRFNLRLGYGYNEATFQSTLFMLSPDNSRALKRGEVGVGSQTPLHPEFGAFDPRSGRPLRQDLGMVVVEPGDRMPGMPLHNLNASLEFQATAKLMLGLTMVAHSGVYLRGNENNEHQAGDSYRVGDPALPGPNNPVRIYDNPGRADGYAVFRLSAEYRLSSRFVAFGQVNNLFDAEYFSGGRLGVNPFSPSTHGAVGASGWNYNADEWRYASFVAPGAPRAVWVGMEWHY